MHTGARARALALSICTQTDQIAECAVHSLMCGCGLFGWSCVKGLHLPMPADRFTSRGSSGCIALLTAITAARTRTHVHVFVRASLKSSPILPPLPSLCSEEESIPPLRNDHKSALVSLAVNKSAFYWKLFIILHSSVHWG